MTSIPETEPGVQSQMAEVCSAPTPNWIKTDQSGSGHQLSILQVVNDASYSANDISLGFVGFVCLFVFVQICE